MAKITIVIEDDGDQVKIDVQPNLLEIIQMNKSGHELTSAHGYALSAMNAMRKESMKNRSSLYIPGTH